MKFSETQSERANRSKMNKKLPNNRKRLKATANNGEEKPTIDREGKELWVGNLPNVNDMDKAELLLIKAELRMLFSNYGSVKDLWINRDYCFVTFATEEEAAYALEDLRLMVFRGKQLRVEVRKVLSAKHD